MEFLESVKAKYIQLKAMQRYGQHRRPALPSDVSVVTCQNCGTQFAGQYCPVCGQSSNTKRLTFGETFGQIINVFLDFDKGFIHTVLELCYRPGYMIRDYIQGHRVEYVKPVKLLFLLGTILLLLHFLLFQHEIPDTVFMNNLDEVDDLAKPYLKVIDQILSFISSNPSLSYLIVTVLMLFPIRICFFKAPIAKSFNMAEHFFAMVYIACQFMLYKILTMPYDRLVSDSFDFGFDFGLPLLLLFSWDFSQLYGIRFRRSVRLTLLAGFLSILLLVVTILLFCAIVYLIFPSLFH